MIMATQDRPVDFYPPGAVPPDEDTITTSDAVARFGVRYTTLQGWWNTGRIQRWHRGWRNVLSVRQLERVVRESKEITPIPPKQGPQGEQDVSK